MKPAVRAIKFIIIPALILFIAYEGYLWNQKTNSVTTDSELDFIIDHISARGKLVDLQDEICVDKIDDVKLFVTEKKIRILFGKINLTWTPEDFASQENIDTLKQIGIEIKYDKDDGRLRVFYLGEEVQRWVS